MREAESGSAQWFTGVHMKVKVLRVLVLAKIRENATRRARYGSTVRRMYLVAQARVNRTVPSNSKVELDGNVRVRATRTKTSE